MVSRADAFRPRRLEPRLHDPVDDRPYYDVDLDVPHSHAHMAMVTDLASIFRTLAQEVGLVLMSDNPVWFFDPRDDHQRVSFPDLVLLAPETDVTRATAEQALFAGEVVSTRDRRKELKDTGYQSVLCAYNEVPEFALFFPEADDGRALTYHRLVGGQYEPLVVGPGGMFESSSIPGLALRVLPKAEWRPGRKVEVLYRGEVRHPLAEERQRAESERQRAEEATLRAAEATLRAEESDLRADEAARQASEAWRRAQELTAALAEAEAKERALRDRLRALGIDAGD